MKIIGVTGKSGSGKSTFSKVLAERLKCKCLDIDKIGHEALYAPSAKNALIEAFGEQIIVNGEVNRKEVGKVVFANKEKMDILTEITWEYMQEIIDEILKTSIEEYIVFDWSLLPNSKYWNVCHYKILVHANLEKRKEKIIERDGITEGYFELREIASWDYRNEKVDYLFTNEYTKESIDAGIEHVLKNI